MSTHCKRFHRHMRTALSLLLAALLSLANVPAPAHAEAPGAAKDVTPIEPEGKADTAEEMFGDVDAPGSSIQALGELIAPADEWESGAVGEDDNDELLEDYLQRPVGEVERACSPVRLMGVRSARARLEGNDLLAYELLRPMVEEVAAGTRSSAVFEIPLAAFGYDGPWTAEQLGVESIVSDGNIAQDAAAAARARVAFSYTNVVRALMADCPYELYWFDKTAGYSYKGCSCSASWSGGEYLLGLSTSPTVSFRVATEYSASGVAGTCDVGTPVQAVNAAVAKAAQIVSDNAGKAAYERLVAYSDAICADVSYNHAAAEDSDTPYGNPWQLIWVFDGDESTNVVCEGYSKAFKYLCDLTWPQGSGDGVECLLATGQMSGGTGAGGHMWNVVRMDDGNNYLVDVTNCDEGAVGHPYELFMAYGPSGSYASGYTFAANGQRILYAYDNVTKDSFGEGALAIAPTAYATPATQGPTEGWTQFGTCEWQVGGDTLTIRPLANGASGTLANTYGTAMPGAGDSAVSHVVFTSGVKAGESMAGLFRGCSNIVSIDFSDLDTSATTDMSQAFEGCSSLRMVTFAAGSKLFDESGLAMLFVDTGYGYWLSDGNGWCYVQAQAGVVTQGWLDVDGSTYYFMPSTRRMATGTQVIDGITYVFDDEGRLVRDGSKDLTQARVSVASPIYTGVPLKPAVVVKLNGKALVRGTDYTVTYRNNVCAGTATAIVTGAGSYFGTTSATFRIRRSNLAGARLTLTSTSLAYTGGARRPAVRVRAGGRSLVAGRDYVLAWSAVSPVAVGTYRVRAVGRGNYAGLSAWASYDVVPRATSLARICNSSWGALTASWVRQMPQTSGYELQMSASRAFMAARSMKVSGAYITSKRVTGLCPGRTYYVRVRTYQVVGGKVYYSAWSATRAVIVY